MNMKNEMNQLLIDYNLFDKKEDAVKKIKDESERRMGELDSLRSQKKRELIEMIYKSYLYPNYDGDRDHKKKNQEIIDIGNEIRDIDDFVKNINNL